MLRSAFDEPEYQNDFAAWAWRSLHDSRLAERLAIVDPSHHQQDIEGLRQELIDVIDERLSESEYVPWARSGQRFKFTRSQIVVFDTGIRIAHPREMADRIARMSLGSIFYHSSTPAAGPARGKAISSSGSTTLRRKPARS